MRDLGVLKERIEYAERHLTASHTARERESQALMVMWQQIRDRFESQEQEIARYRVQLNEMTAVNDELSALVDRLIASVEGGAAESGNETVPSIARLAGRSRRAPRPRRPRRQAHRRPNPRPRRTPPPANSKTFSNSPPLPPSLPTRRNRRRPPQASAKAWRRPLTMTKTTMTTKFPSRHRNPSTSRPRAKESAALFPASKTPLPVRPQRSSTALHLPIAATAPRTKTRKKTKISPANCAKSNPCGTN